ncbi:MAG TPA: DUF4363 family protein [Bacillota bacterium]
MKAWILSVIGFLLLLGFGAGSNRYLHNSSNRVVLLVNRIDSAIESEDWQLAVNRLVKATHYWKRIKSWWALLIHHQELDNIENALVKLEKAIQCQDQNNSQMISGELQYFLQHIPQREKFTVINIL